MIRIRWIEQTIVGVVSNLTNYGPFLMSLTTLEYCFLPMIFLGACIGYYKRLDDIINISQWTYFQFSLRVFFLSLTVGSFCALGLGGLINDTFFLYDDDYAPTEHQAYIQDLNYARYITFTIMLFASFFRNPHAHFFIQHFRRYTSNWMNGIGMVLSQKDQHRVKIWSASVSGVFL